MPQTGQIGPLFGTSPRGMDPFAHVAREEFISPTKRTQRILCATCQRFLVEPPLEAAAKAALIEFEWRVRAPKGVLAVHYTLSHSPFVYFA